MPKPPEGAFATTSVRCRLFTSRRRRARYLSTKPACQQSCIDAWSTILAPQPNIEPQRRFYYQLQRTIDDQLGRVAAYPGRAFGGKTSLNGVDNPLTFEKSSASELRRQSP